MTGLRKVFAASVAVVFVLCLSNVTLAKEAGYSIKGRVASIDPLTQELTVKSSDKFPGLIGGTPGEYTFSMDKITRVTMCGKEKTVEDIVIDQEVTVSYHEFDGQLYADSITIPTPLLACLW